MKKFKQVKLNILISILVIFLIGVLAFGAYLCITLQCKVAHADETATIEVIKAPVSNLKENSTAGKSVIAVSHTEGTFYIPESYYLTKIENAFAGIKKANYLGADVYFKDSDGYTVTSVAARDNLNTLFPSVTLSLSKDSVPLYTQNTDQTTQIVTYVEKVDGGITNEHNLLLFGYSENSDYIYVKATLGNNVKFGFIKSDDLVTFAVPYEASTQAEREAILKADAKPDISKGEIAPPPETSVALRIIIIVGIAIPVVIMSIVIFLRKSADKSRYVGAENSPQGVDRTDYDRDRTLNRNYDDNPDDGNYNN